MALDSRTIRLSIQSPESRFLSRDSISLSKPFSNLYAMESSLSKLSGEIWPALWQANNPEVASPKEAKATYKYWTYSFIERRQYPSAMFRCTESAAAIFWEATLPRTNENEPKTSEVAR